MKRLIGWFVRNPVAANLIMVIMLVAGTYGALSMKREFLPTVDVNGMSVSVEWPGASPRDVAEQLIVRIEDAVDGISGVEYIESQAYEGYGNVNIKTVVNADYEKLIDDVKAKIDGINNLPPDSFRPQVRRWEFRPDIMFLALYGDMDRLALQRAGNDLRLRLTKLTGLSLTEQISKVSEQVTIEVSEENLLRYGLTFSQVANAIGQSSVNLSAGTVETSSGNLQMRARALANTKAEFENIVIRQTSDGSRILVKDIATVIDGFDNLKFNAEYKGQTTAIFQVKSPDNLNITKAGEAIRKFEKEINASLPPGVNFAIWFDGSTMFDSRMELIGRNAVQGMVLVLIVLMLFLRPAVALWVTVGIGAAFLGALAIAPAMGVTLNMISLFAFLLVIGIVVDDAIVVGESIYFHNEHGVNGERGAIAGANLVAKPVFFAVITTIMMFVPWMLLSVPLVAITEQISLVVIAVLIFSLIEAFFILPAHLRHLKPIDEKKASKGLIGLQRKIANSLNTFAEKRFRPLVAALIKFRYYTAAFFIGLMFMAITLLTQGVAPVSMFPEVDGDMIVVNARFPEGTKFDRVEDVRKQVQAGINKFNENSQKDFGINGDIITNPGTISTSREVEGYLGLMDANERSHVSTKDLADKLEEYVGPVPDAYRVNYGFTEGGDGEGTGVRFGVASDDPEDLKRAILDIKNTLETYSSVVVAWDSLESSASELQFTLKPGAESLGLTLADVTRQVREAFFGREVQRLPRNGDNVRVMVRYPEAARESIDSLKTLRIRTASGVEVPLPEVAEVTTAEGVGRISRRDRKQLEYVGARLRGEPAEVQAVKDDLRDNFFPQWRASHPNAERVLVGQDSDQATLMRELIISGWIVLGSMYMLLAVAFRSYAQPLLIMVAIPFALAGMIFGNIITDVPFGMLSLFGLFAAAGVAVNDNLVLIDYVNKLRAKGVGAYQSMLDACVARFRPILLTSVTTFIGITPILFETSMQAQFLKPMVVALAFGVLFDFFLTLMLVPALYGIGIDIKRMFKGWWTGERQPGLGSRYDPKVALALEDLELDEDAISPKPTGDTAPQPAE